METLPEKKWKLEAVNSYQTMKIAHGIKPALSKVKKNSYLTSKKKTISSKTQGRTKKKQSIKVKNTNYIGGN